MVIVEDVDFGVRTLAPQSKDLRILSRRPRIKPKWLALASILVLLPASAEAQRVVGTVSVESSSVAAAVNPITNKIYVVNQGSDSVTAIDGITHATTRIPVGKVPLSVAVNPLTNRIYVADSQGVDQFGNINAGGITMIDANNNNATTYKSDQNISGPPQVVAVDPVTNLVFASNQFGRSVSVFDGNLNFKTTVNLGSGGGLFQVFIPDLAVDSARGKVYVSGSLGPTGEGITIIDEKDLTNAHPIQVGVGAPSQLVLDPVTNRVFVLGVTTSLTGTNATPAVFIIDINSCQTTNPNLPPCNSTSTPLGAFGGIALNAVTHKVYAGNGGGVTVIDGSQSGNPTSFIALPLTASVGAVAVNPLTNRIYVSTPGGNSGTGQMFVIDANTGNSITASFSNNASAVLTVNPITNRIYTTAATGTSNDELVVIDGATESPTPLSSQNTAGPTAIAVNPVTHKVYVANMGFDSRTNTGIASVSVFDMASQSVVKPAIFDPNAHTPVAIAANPITNKIYVANFDSNNVTVIDGNTDSYETTITDPAAVGPIGVIANPVNNKVYVANNGGNVTVIDGGSNQIISTIAAGPAPFALAVDNFVSHISPGTVLHKIYVVNNVPSGGGITEIDGDTDRVTGTIPTGGFPYAIAVDPVANQVWVANDGSNDVTMVDAETHQTRRVADPSAAHPRSIGVLPSTDNVRPGKVYVGNRGSNNVTIINLIFGFPFKTVPVGVAPTSIAVNPNTNHVYVANFASDNLSVIDGATNSVTTLKDPLAFGPVGVVVDPAFNQAYAANSDEDDQGSVGSDSITVINEERVQLSQLQSFVTPLLGDQTTSLTPTLAFTATSAFTPFAPPIDHLFFQLDSWEGPWTPASSAGPNVFTATPALQPGLHSLYTFASDSRETSAGTQTKAITPFTGSITAFAFVAGASSFLTVTVAGSGTVTSSPPGVNCPGTCRAGFNAGSSVTLTATASSGSVFTGWGGACAGAGTGACTVTMNGVEVVTATFAPLLLLTVTETGKGSITSSPAGINCGTTCNARFAGGTTVTLTATPTALSAFAGWGGACTGLGTTCRVTMNRDQSVTALFIPGFNLTVIDAGSGKGTVTSSPAGISCGTTCSANFGTGTSVTLTAAAALGSTFVGWSGACAGALPSCQVTINAGQSVTASFNLTFRLTVRKGGARGTVTSVPPGINCGLACIANFSRGSSVTLTAKPGPGAVFVEWLGACTGRNPSCTVNMNSSKLVGAVFR